MSGKTIGKIAASGTAMNPDAELIGAKYGHDNLKDLATNRMRDFLKAESVKHLAPLYELKIIQERASTTPEARGFAYTLLENNGSVERKDHWRTLKDLDQRSRRQLREANVQFGQYNVYIKTLMKPKPAFFLSLLTSYGAGGDQKPFIPFAGVTSIPNEGDFSSENFSKQALSAAGYHAVGPRIARFDILNRLSLQIRQANEQNRAAKRGKGFQVMQEMLAIMGCSYDEIRGVLTALGFVPETRDLSKYPPISDIVENPSAKIVEASIPVEQKAPEVSLDSTKTDPETITETPSTEAKNAKQDGEQSENSASSKQPPKPNKKAQKPLNIYNHRIIQEDGTTVEIENNEFWLPPVREKAVRYGTQNKGKHNKKKKYTKPKREKDFNSGPTKHSPKPENSPFAALAALKANKKD